MQRHITTSLRTISQPNVLARGYRFSSSHANPEVKSDHVQKDQTTETTSQSKEKAKPKTSPTIAEQDEALRVKMSGLSGEGGEAGVEYENGEPVAMKRSVKNNMFRYI